MQAWHDFYLTAGGASAALLGLLFVGVSIHLDEVVRHPDVRLAARGAFQALIAVLISALIALIPQVTPGSFGVALLALGVAGLLADLRSAGRMIGARPLLGMGRALQRLGFRMAGMAVLVVAGGLFLAASSDAAAVWLMSGVFVLFGSSARAAWYLVIEVAEAKRAEGAEGALPDPPSGAPAAPSLTPE